MTDYTPRVTPRATPVAPAPTSRRAPVSEAVPKTYALRAPVVVVAPDCERELAGGALTIGRLPTADIVLEDPLVSRVHARVSIVDGGAVIVEDLHSTNGVFVNGVRITRAHLQLYDGDRLLIGTTELSLFSTRRRPTEATTIPAQGPPLPFSNLPKVDAIPSTARADAIEVIGKLATRHAASGNVAEAVRILSTHLNKVLLGATAGLAVPGALLDRATHFAVELFRWTNNAAWIDYVIELHLSTQQVPTDATLSLLEATLKSHEVKFDRMLLVYLVEKLDAKKDTLSEAELSRWVRLERITRYL